MNGDIKACVYFVIIMVLTVCVWNFLMDLSNYETQDIEYSGIVTDKWTHQSWGGTVYRIEIDNNQTKTVDDSEYYNYEIGDFYYWIKTKLVHKETGEIVKFTKAGND